MNFINIKNCIFNFFSDFSKNYYDNYFADYIELPNYSDLKKDKFFTFFCAKNFISALQVLNYSFPFDIDEDTLETTDITKLILYPYSDNAYETAIVKYRRSFVYLFGRFFRKDFFEHEICPVIKPLCILRGLYSIKKNGIAMDPFSFLMNWCDITACVNNDNLYFLAYGNIKISLYNMKKIFPLFFRPKKSDFIINNILCKYIASKSKFSDLHDYIYLNNFKSLNLDSLDKKGIYYQWVINPNVKDKKSVINIIYDIFNIFKSFLNIRNTYKFITIIINLFCNYFVQFYALSFTYSYYINQFEIHDKKVRFFKNIKDFLKYALFSTLVVILCHIIIVVVIPSFLILSDVRKRNFSFPITPLLIKIIAYFYNYIFYIKYYFKIL